jgi:hypothetical protein
VAARLAAGAGPAGFARAAAAGLGAAAAGAGIYFAVREATGYNFSLVSILVGYMVGRAVHWGARGRGGWPYQTLAVLLTYLAIVSTYVPPLVTAIKAHADARTQAAARTQDAARARAAPATTTAHAPAAGTGTAGQPTAAGTAAGRPTAAGAATAQPTDASTAGTRPTAVHPGASRPPSLAAYAFAYLWVLGIATTLPFVGAIGVIGLIIIAVGLFEAWKLNQRPRIAISGPHAVASPGWRS